MVRKLLRSRKISKLKKQSNSIIDMALDHLDRPTDLKDIFHLNLKCDFDTLVGNQEAALICDKYDSIIAMDIRLATLRFFGSHKSSHAFQCLSYIPELLKDQRALRSLHTYFNRLGLHDFAEDLLGSSNFNLKKKNKRERIKSLFLPASVSASKLKPDFRNKANDKHFPEDMIKFDFNHLSERIVRHLSRVSLSEFMNDILEVLKIPKIEIRRRREILFISGELIIEQSIESALTLLKETELFVKDARFSRRVAQSLEKINRSDEAIKILSYASDQTSQRLCLAITERHQWKQNGYNIDYLEPVSDYRPIKDRVLYHIHASINHTTSGYSTRTHHICKSLIEQGVDLHVRTRWGYPCDRKEIDLKPENVLTEVIDNVTYLHDPIEEGFGAYAMEDYAQRAAHSLLRTALELKPSVIHAASNHAVGFSAAMVARALGIPFVYEMRGLWALSRAAKDPIYRQQDRFQLEMALEKHVALAADHVIVITDGLRAQLIDWGIPEEKISLAPNGVDTSRFKVQKRHQKLEQELMLNGKIVIGYVGSLLKYEGLDYLLDAIATFPDQLKKNIAVLIVGDGEHRKVLEQQTKHHHLEQIVKFVGRVPLEEVSSYYSLIDISPFPRISAEVCEMISPLKPLEAMAMGSVVLASNVRAIAEHVIPNVNGILFEKESINDLAKKLRELIEQPELITQYSLEARSWVEERRNWSLITSIISSVYEHITSNGILQHWDLDVLPSVFENGTLGGIVLEPEKLLFKGPKQLVELNNSRMIYEKDKQWSLSYESKLISSIDIKSGNLNWSKYPSQLPSVEYCYVNENLQSGFRKGTSFLDAPMTSQTCLYVCNEFTTLEQIHAAIQNHSILLSSQTEYLHGYVGIVSTPEHYESIFDAISSKKMTHSSQRKENWRRQILRTHPLLQLIEKSFDRSHLLSIDPLRYTITVDTLTLTDVPSFISQIITQRVRPTSVIFSSQHSLEGLWDITVNAMKVNGIEVLVGIEDSQNTRNLSYSFDMDENSGLDHCLIELLNGGTLFKKPRAQNLIQSTLRINKRILVIGHDLKFITEIAKTWKSWGLQVTLLKSKNHAGKLDITTGKLLAMIGNHDVIFCEWALGNAAMLSKLRGTRPLIIRYHAQERNTEYILETNLIEKDLMIFVSKHTMELENRIQLNNKKIVIPNSVNTVELNIERTNPEGLGIMGITPRGKGLHRALELIHLLSKQGSKQRLLLKGKLPKDYPWMKHRADENAWYAKQFSKYKEFFSKELVVQEGFTPNVTGFLSRVNTVLSVSDHESFHLAPLEAAAARSQVHMLPWFGSEQIHHKDWIFDDLDLLSANYLSIIQTGTEYENGERNRQFVSKNYDLNKISAKLLCAILEHSVDSRDTVAPILQKKSLFSDILPKTPKLGPVMRIHSLTHQENDLPPLVDIQLRQKKKTPSSTIILAHYADLNLIDGSAIWYVSMASMLALTGAHVVCPISSEALYSPIIQPLIDNPHISLITPKMMEIESVRKVTLEQYLRIVNDISRWYGESNIIVARGFELIQELTEMSKNVVLWAYLTDYYTHELDGKRVVREQTKHLVQQITEQNGTILCQTSLIKNELIEISNCKEQNFIDIPPIIPNSLDIAKKVLNSEKLNIIYAGKMAPLWGVEPLLDLASAECKITIIGDKIHRGPPHDAMFQSRMEMKLKTSEYIRWIPRLSRKLVLENLAMADLAWCARDPYFESQTQELSTKILESLSVGTPPIVIRSKLHEELLGNNWPFFVEDLSDRTFLIDIDEKKLMAKECMQQLQPKIAKHFMESVASRFKKLLNDRQIC